MPESEELLEVKSGWDISTLENLPKNPTSELVFLDSEKSIGCEDDYDTCSCDCRVDCNKD